MNCDAGIERDRAGNGPERHGEAGNGLPEGHGNPSPCPEGSQAAVDDLDEATLAGLRRVAAAIDGLPPKVDARPVRLDDGLPCCEDHNRFCEPPGDLCCRNCAEVAHPGHLDGSDCVIGVDR